MTAASTRDTGRRGEDEACRYLSDSGYNIIARNIYLSHNEIDIIAEDDNFIVFVEVKSRLRTQDDPDRFGRPANAVSEIKRKSVLKAVLEYLRQHKYTKQPRIDVIEVYLGRHEADSPEIKHIRNAFGA